MTSTRDLFITSVEIARIEAMGMGPTIRGKVEYQLPDWGKKGNLDSLDVVNKPNDDGRLVLKLDPTLANKVLIRMKVQSVPCDTYCVLELNAGMKHKVDFDFGGKQVTGPTVVVKGDDVHIFTGKTVKVIPGIVKRGERLDVMFVENAITILSPIKRAGIRLIIPNDSRVTLTAYINTKLDDIDPLMDNNTQNEYSSGNEVKIIARSRL